MNNTLIQAVKKQLGEDWQQNMGDIANDGIGGGFCGFTYNSELFEFFVANQAEIVSLVKDQSEEFGLDPIAFVAGFNCLDDDRETRDEIGRCLYGSPTQEDCLVPSALAWFAGTEASRYCNN